MMLLYGEMTMTDRTSAELDAWLAEVEKRCKAATPGPWKGWVGRRIADVRDSVGNAIIHWAGFDSSTVRTWRERGANARFIAHARTDVPELLRLVRELQARVVDLENELAETEQELSEMNERYDQEHPRWVFGQ